MELGIYTFAEQTTDPNTGETISARQRLRNLMEEIELADSVGLDVFGVGEHHRPDFVVSAPAIVLAAAGERTKQIRLTSAVNVISSDDPVRIFQDFATLDLLTGGRAEIMAGRGSFIESFPLFGYDLHDYDSLFEEKLLMLLELRESEIVNWQGRHRPAIENRGVYPRPLQHPLPIWVAVGGNPRSAVRAGALGLPMALAIIGGMPERFAPFAEMHRDAARQAGWDPAPPLSINSHGYIAENAHQAIDDSFPYVAVTMNCGDDEQDRQGAGLGTADPPGLQQQRSPTGGQLRRHAPAGDRQDPFPVRHLPARPLPGSVQRRHHAA